MMIDIILMASGGSKRFGLENKLMYKIKEKPMFEYALENAVFLKREMPYLIDNIIVVSKYKAVKKICSRYNVIYTENTKSFEGISASIKLGMDKAGADNAAAFMVCDQPYIKKETLLGLFKGFSSSGKAVAMIRRRDGATANPCIFAPALKAELYALKGDKGGKSVAMKNINDVFFYDVSNDRELMDIDIKPLYFDFMNERGHIISITGAGGKTTLMYALAEELSARGHKTLVTTTTHIMKPDILAENENEITELWKKGTFAVVGRVCEDGKIMALPYAELKKYMALADTVIIEADGAKSMPCKVPGENEPVIIEECDIVIGVMGADALGKPLFDVCFRINEAEKLLKKSRYDILTEEDAAEILYSLKGTRKYADKRKYYVLINKCDNYALIEKGKKIKGLLNKKGIFNVFLYSFKGCDKFE